MVVTIATTFFIMISIDPDDSAGTQPQKITLFDSLPPRSCVGRKSTVDLDCVVVGADGAVSAPMGSLIVDDVGVGSPTTTTRVVDLRR